MRAALLVLLALAGCAGPGPSLEGRTTVLFFIGTQCPASNRYNARMIDLARDFPGVELRGVNSNRNETEAEVAAHARRAGFPFRVEKDQGHALADRFHVETTPTACLIDVRGELRYRGRIDDDLDETRVISRDLRDAIEAVLADRPVGRPETPTSGCRIKRAAAGPARGEVTYARHAASILNRACLRCHRRGQIGPFSLEGYEDASAWAPEIKKYVASRRMPPWKPVSRDVAYANERRLSDEEIRVLSDWADGGAPPGDLRQAPPAPNFPDGWALGPPDLILEPPADYEVEARGADVYRAFVLPTGLSEDRYVTAAEFKPGTPAVVHHIMTYIDASGTGRRKDEADPGIGFDSQGTGPGFFPAGDLGGWGPGMQVRALPPGVGRLLPKGADLVMEVHYHKSGRVERDRTRVGLYFAKGPVTKKVRSNVVLDMTFEIPAGAARHPVTSVWGVPEDLHAHAVIPHMHLLGREIDVTARFKDGTRKTLVRIDDWDFNWQESYFFEEPVALPRGTLVVVTSWFDNRAENPRNPNHPPRPVRFGVNTTDEMSVAYVAFTRDIEDLTKPKKDE